MQTECLRLQGIQTHAKLKLPGSGGGGGGSSATTDAASLLAMERVVMRPLRRPWLLAVFSAAWSVLLLTLFLLSLTLLFIFTDVPAEAKVRNKGSPPPQTQFKHLFIRSERAEHRVTNADTVSTCEFLTSYDVFVFHNRISHRSQNHFCTVLCVHRKVKNLIFFIINSTFCWILGSDITGLE